MPFLCVQILICKLCIICRKTAIFFHLFTNHRSWGTGNLWFGTISKMKAQLSSPGEMMPVSGLLIGVKVLWKSWLLHYSSCAFAGRCMHVYVFGYSGHVCTCRDLMREPGVLLKRPNVSLCRSGPSLSLKLDRQPRSPKDSPVWGPPSAWLIGGHIQLFTWVSGIWTAVLKHAKYSCSLSHLPIPPLLSLWTLFIKKLMSHVLFTP